jgi:hypothetical protein
MHHKFSTNQSLGNCFECVWEQNDEVNGDNYAVKCPVIYTYHVLLGDKMKETEMVVACKEVELRNAHK